MNETRRLGDRAVLTQLLNDPEPFLAAGDAANRRIAVAASLHYPHLFDQVVDLLLTDPESTVRRECAEVLGLSGRSDVDALAQALQDDVAEVREAAANALGELAAAESVGLLIEHATNDDEDKLVREAAVAALGAIGDDRAVPALLTLLSGGPPQIRRRCVPSLSVFDGEHIESALREAGRDRNPMVREAAEMIVGRSTD